MKTCTKCGVEKPEESFHRKNSGVFYSSCIECHRAYVQDHYRRNKQYYIDKSRAARDRANEYIRQAKSGPCTDCGVTYPPYVMQFDHMGNDKIINVSIMTRGTSSIKRIQAEIDKCEVVCANCHAVRTWERAHDE